MEDGGWRMEDGGWRMEDGGWRMEDGGRRMEVEDGCVEGLIAGMVVHTVLVLVLLPEANVCLSGWTQRETLAGSSMWGLLTSLHTLV